MMFTTSSQSSTNYSDQADPRTLIDELLAQQQQFTAVENFSLAQDRNEVRGPLYRSLLPATPPAAGQQYGFEVNLDRCTGCKACVSACHSLNGLDDGEVWRSVGLLVDAPALESARRKTKPAFQQNVTTACHHCVDPACLNGCPVLAYDKDPFTGIVRHLDDQCIGCQYCVMMCPYEVPQYSKERGIVRKCDMCHSRLNAGEAPACVQACPTAAITIKLVDQAKIRGKYRGVANLDLQSTTAPAKNPATGFLPASPNPAITLPTTHFVTQRNFPEKLFGGDHQAIVRSDAHIPLVILLTFSQLAAGAVVASVAGNFSMSLLMIALASGLIALVSGSLHLGRPLKAWRSFLGWRKSWFSREVIAMSIFLALVVGVLVIRRLGLAGTSEKLLDSLAAAFGLAMVACSSMIYVATRRDFWMPRWTFTSFFGTTFVLGAAAALATFACTTASYFSFSIALPVLLSATLGKLGAERRIFFFLTDEEQIAQTPLNKTARLLAGELNVFVRVRIACALLGGLGLPLAAWLQYDVNARMTAVLAITGLGLCVAGELIERYLFFVAVVPEKMPGGLAS